MEEGLLAGQGGFVSTSTWKDASADWRLVLTSPRMARNIASVWSISDSVLLTETFLLRVVAPCCWSVATGIGRSCGALALAESGCLLLLPFPVERGRAPLPLTGGRPGCCCCC